jgi:K+-sensing histidine kinase KdpD
MIYNTTLICVNRLFPLLFVASAYGILNFCAHTVACLAPFVAEIHDPLPFIAFVTLVFVAVLSSTFLVEVKEQEAMKEVRKESM